VRISAEPGNDIRDEVFFRFADARIPVLAMSSEEVTLEKVFLELTADGGESLYGSTAGLSFAEDEEEEDDAYAAEDEADGAAEEAPETDGEADDDYTPLFGGKK